MAGGTLMSWAHTARQKQRAPIGQYKPEAYRVLVYDTFTQYKLGMAARIVGCRTVPEFFLFCANYVLSHHRDLKRLRSIFRKGERDIKAAAAAPVDDETSPFVLAETIRDRRRAEAFNRFARWAEEEL
ncbi:MAG: hypothetical protein QOH06_2843 [Acidobacteriota bacterium]|nr:hypothetical protein [Acidobacteriota bacterium]